MYTKKIYFGLLLLVLLDALAQVANHFIHFTAHSSLFAGCTSESLPY